MSIITTLLNFAAPLIQLWLLFLIRKELRVISIESERKKELNETIKKFGTMFAEASEVPRPPRTKKVVHFEASE